VRVHEDGAGAVGRVAGACARDGDEAIEALPEAERRQVLEEWNATEADYPKEKLIHELFEEQVERSPDAVALVYEDGQLSYGRVECPANRLAHYLRRHGVGPESLVGIMVERSVEMVVGLLGALKAGGGYVPIDQEYPRERIALMLGDARVRLLLTQQDLMEKLPQHAAEVLSWTPIGSV